MRGRIRRTYRAGSSAEVSLLELPVKQVRILVQTCIDWALCGLKLPVHEEPMPGLAAGALQERRSDMDTDRSYLLPRSRPVT